MFDTTFKINDIPEMRECKRCFSVIPIDQMYQSQTKGFLGSRTTRICNHCAASVAYDAGELAKEAEAAKYSTEVTIGDLVPGHKINKK